MKKTVLLIAIVGVAVLALGVTGFSYAQSQKADLIDWVSGVGGLPSADDPNPPFPGQPGPRFAGNNPLHEYLFPAMAEGFGLTADELRARLDDGATLWTLGEEQNMTLKEYRTLFENAREQALSQAVADGAITQDQADKISETPVVPFGMRRIKRGPARPEFPFMKNNGPLSDYMLPAIANQLGMTADELQARLDGGETMREIIGGLDLSQQEIHDLLEQAQTEAIDQAVADGTLTQEQADWMLNHGPKNGFGPGNKAGCGPKGPGHHGPGGKRNNQPSP